MSKGAVFVRNSLFGPLSTSRRILALALSRVAQGALCCAAAQTHLNASKNASNNIAKASGWS